MTNDIVPDEIGEYEGYRLFRVSSQKNLRSYSKPYVWTPGDNEAYCDRVKPTKVLRNGPDGTLVESSVYLHTPIPDPSCECGFWIYKSEIICLKKMGLTPNSKRKGMALRNAAGAVNSFGNFGVEKEIGTTLAKVTCWGNVIHGTDGYRAEWAKIVSLIPRGGVQLSILQEISLIYNAPIEDAEEQFKIESAERKIITSKVNQIISGGISPNTGRSRPHIVLFDSSIKEFKVWEGKELTKLRKALKDDTEVEVGYEEDYWQNIKSRLIVSVDAVKEG